MIGYRKLSKEEVRFIDRVMMFVSIIHPLTAIPQAVTIFMSHSATDVSLVTWLSFMLIGVIFLIYALAHRIAPMIVNQVIWFAVDLVIVFGIVLYS